MVTQVSKGNRGAKVVEVTVTAKTVRVVSVGDLADHEWRAAVKEHGLEGCVFDVADYTTDGYRHEWLFTYSPAPQVVC